MIDLIEKVKEIKKDPLKIIMIKYTPNNKLFGIYSYIV